MKKKLIIFTAIAMMLTACSNTQQTTTIEAGESSESTAVALETSLVNVSYATTEEFPDTVDLLAFNDTSATTFKDGDDILITQSGTYEFTGTYEASQIVVNVDKDNDKGVVYLVLNNASFTSADNTPIYIMEAKDVVIVLEGENFVTQGDITTTDEEFPGGAIYSKADTVITGDGSLVVSTLYQDGINCRDDLIIIDSTISVSAIEDGIVGKDLLAISNANLTIVSGKDGIKTSNEEDADKGELIIQGGAYLINATGDAISSENLLQIDEGIFELYSGNGFVKVLNSITVGEGAGNTVSATSLLETSAKGLKGLNITINGGTFNISAYEDAIHANNILEINGGEITILTGDDAVHADYELIINDGTITVEEGYEGIEAEYVTVNGGNIWVSVLDDAMNAGTLITVTGGEIYLESQGDGIDSNGDLIIEGGNFIINNNAIYSGGDGSVDVTGSVTYTGGTLVDGQGNTIDPTQMLSSKGGFSQPSRTTTNIPTTNMPTTNRR